MTARKVATAGEVNSIGSHRSAIMKSIMFLLKLYEKGLDSTAGTSEALWCG